MMKFFCLISILLFTTLVTNAQIAVVDDNFEGVSFPFEGWEEINTTGQVTIVNEELQFDYTTQKPGAIRTFDPAGGVIHVRFNARSTRNWIHYFVYFRDHQQDTIAAITLGSAGNRGIFAITEIDDDGMMAAGVNGLNEEFSVNQDYQISFSLNTFDQTATMYVDDVLMDEAEGMPLLAQADSLSSLVFLNDYMFSDEGRVFIDDLSVVYYQVDKTELSLLIRQAEQILEEAEAGTSPGQYPDHAFDMLNDELASAQAVYDNLDATETEVTAAADDLLLAIEAFSGSQIPYMATIDVQTSEGHPLNEGFSGFNVRIADGPWNYNHPDFREAVQSLHPGFLRYFSGTTGSYFNMNTGMMEYEWFEQLRNHGNPQDGIPDLYKWVEVKGPHRLIDLYDMLGENSAKLVITFNSFVDTPENAAKLARFCKNNNIIVDYWQFTNEPNFYTPPRRYFFNDGKDYAVKQKEVAEAILAVDPDARLALSYGWDGLGEFAIGISDYSPEYWNTVSFHSYALRAADTDFDFAMSRANARVVDRTNNAFYNKIQSRSWPGAPFIVTEYGVWNDMLSQTLYGAIYLSEYVMRMSALPNASLIGNHVVNHAARPDNYHRDLYMDAFDAGVSIDPDTVPTGYNLRIDGVTFSIVNKALNNADFVCQTHIQGGATVPTMGGGSIDALYARAYRGVVGNEYLLITNKSNTVHELDILLDGEENDMPLQMTYAWDPDPSVGNVEVNTKTTSSPVRVPSYSVVRIEWDSDSIPTPKPTRIYNLEHGENSAHLQWWERETAENYILHYGTGSGAYNQSVTIDGETTEFEVTGLNAGQTYYFAVEASSANGTSGLSNEVAYHVAVPEAPLLDVMQPLSQRVKAEWESVPFANGYVLKYGTQPGVYDHEIDVGNVTGYVVRDLTNNTEYYFSVVAYNGMGESSLSNEMESTPRAQIPMAPRYLHGHENALNGVVNLTWIPSDSTHQATYNLYRSEKAWSGYELVESGIQGTSYADSTFLTAGKYFYHVRAENERGESFYHSNIFTMDKQVDTEDFFTNIHDMTYEDLLMPGFINPHKGDRFGPLNEIPGLRFRIRMTDIMGRLVYDGGWNEYWNGYANGTPVPRGAYIWQIQGHSQEDPFYKSGKVLVVY